ncbi:hypothetical protein HYX13_04430 [Candidatus Woesearchaeota archaeon]|nr:hypothetical protein [Candidatus Woesearchaeota archaeon]
MELYKYPILEPTAEQNAMELYESILPKIEHYGEWKAVIRILGLREKFADLSQVPKEFQDQMSDQVPQREVAVGLKFLLLACKESKFPEDASVLSALGKFPYLTYATFLLACESIAEGKNPLYFTQAQQFVKNPIVPQIWAGSLSGEKYLLALTTYLEESVQASYAFQSGQSSPTED